MTPRQAAAAHLPELATSMDLLASTFGAQLVHLTTPAGTLGSPPPWTTWPSVRLDEFHPLPVPPERTRHGR